MLHVLLVDDEPIVKIALRTMMDWEELGFSICGTASDGIEALALVKELQPDIIITDLKMPNMNGLQLIRELNELEYKGKIIVASNFGEYELVREALLLGAVDYMLKISIKTETLIEQLQKTAKLLKEQQVTLQEQETREQVLRSNLKSVKNTMLKEYFTNPYSEADEVFEHQEIHWNFLNRACYLFYINLEGASLKAAQKISLTLSFIENMILDLIESEQDAEVIQAEAHSILVLIEKERLHLCGFEPQGFAQRIQKLIRMYMTMEPVIVYSPEICGYPEAKEAYAACKDAIDINFYEEHSLICSNDIKLKHDIEFANYVDFSNAILRLLYEEDHVSIARLLTDFVEQAKHNGVHPAALKSFVYKCLDYLPLCDPKLKIKNPEEYEANWSKILECKSSETLLAFTMAALEELRLWTEISSVQNVPVTRKEIAEVVQYIGSRYQDKITLEMIADHVNFSENYLCRVFRDQMGVSLIHYLNTVRMNKAAELIMKGHTYIKEIAALVGIGDQFYFSRMFKKQFGVSPTDYKSHVLASHSQHKQKSFPG
ncbi:response regulator [Paenibacillus pinisoli]|uniref:Response regulator n=1 Tax=Paenibacillus pinisoli TaxID=1276110 RepID=A0A3A6PF90_9BACL|nr:response regulator [Paenibacillus pinisoli]RJX37508.1 response regulator [Paenibacillus pinisoli]